MKRCSMCKEEKPLGAFGVTRKNKDGLNARCKECHNATWRRWLEVPGNLEKQRRLQQKYNEKTADRRKAQTAARTSSGRAASAMYGIDYSQTLERHGDKCAICKKSSGEAGKLSVDHDHSCCAKGKSCGNCVRGLLCRKCNSGIGFFEEDAALLSAAISYLADPPLDAIVTLEIRRRAKRSS